jgi:hypothetical protein
LRVFEWPFKFRIPIFSMLPFAIPLLMEPGSRQDRCAVKCFCVQGEVHLTLDHLTRGGDRQENEEIHLPTGRDPMKKPNQWPEVIGYSEPINRKTLKIISRSRIGRDTAA